MKPKFRDRATWDRAQVLMQPIYIRVVDNIRKYIEQAGAGWTESFIEVEEPRPGYRLCLDRPDAPGAATVRFDLWALCFQVCFQAFPPGAATAPVAEPEIEVEVEVDGSLFDEADEIDWDAIDRKAAAVVAGALAPVLGDG